MSKKFIYTFFAIFLSLGMMAQGIQFETGTWEEVLSKAKSENKLIYLDVYAEWCGPCKMMARDVFPNDRAGNKYNALFINYKVDAEKGEGKIIARKYGVSSYPTNLYINPHTEKPVYRIAGACGVDEFLKRADIAQLDYTDPMKWEDYQKKLKSNPKDFEFLVTYINKAQRIGENYDNALNVYVENFLSTPIHDSQLAFLLTYVQNMDNKGYTVLTQNRERADNLVQDPRYKLEEREKGLLLNNTFKKAVEMKDVKVLHSTKPVLYKYNPFDTLGKWYNIENHFYRAIEDEKKLYTNYTNTIQYYEKLGKTKIQELDAKSFQQNIDLLKSNPRYNNISEEALQNEIKVQIKRNPGFKYQVSINQLQTYISAAEYVLNLKNPSKKQLKQVSNWLNEAEKLIPEENVEFTDKVYDLKAKYYVMNKMNDAAVSITNKRIEFLKTKKMPTQNAEIVLTKIQNGTLLKSEK